MKFTAVFTALVAASGALALPLDTDQSENPENLQASRFEGINCRGSDHCRDYIRSGESVARRLRDYCNDIEDRRYYRNGEPIACFGRGSRFTPDGGFCVFLQYTHRNVNGASIRRLIRYIIDHGCNTCGSVPIGFPGRNDRDDGILTIDYLSIADHCCHDGLC